MDPLRCTARRATISHGSTWLWRNRSSRRVTPRPASSSSLTPMKSLEKVTNISFSATLKSDVFQCNVRGSGRRMEGKQKEWKGRHDYRYGMEGVTVRGRGNESQRPCGAWWLIGRVDAYRPKGRGFESRSSHHIGQVLHSPLPVALRRETSTQYPCCIGSASE